MLTLVLKDIFCILNGCLYYPTTWFTFTFLIWSTGPLDQCFRARLITRGLVNKFMYFKTRLCIVFQNEAT